jgi:hypothetical protein
VCTCVASIAKVTSLLFQGQEIYFGFLDILQTNEESFKMQDRMQWWMHRAQSDVKLQVRCFLKRVYQHVCDLFTFSSKVIKSFIIL